MSEGHQESGDIVENPEPEADAELPVIGGAVEDDREVFQADVADQPEDDGEVARADVTDQPEDDGQVARADVTDQPEDDGQVARADVTDRPEDDGQVARADVTDQPEDDGQVARADVTDRPEDDGEGARADVTDQPEDDVEVARADVTDRPEDDGEVARADVTDRPEDDGEVARADVTDRPEAQADVTDQPEDECVGAELEASESERHTNGFDDIVEDLLDVEGEASESERHSNESNDIVEEDQSLSVEGDASESERHADGSNDVVEELLDVEEEASESERHSNENNDIVKESMDVEGDASESERHENNEHSLHVEGEEAEGVFPVQIGSVAAPEHEQARVTSPECSRSRETTPKHNGADPSAKCGVAGQKPIFVDASFSQADQLCSSGSNFSVASGHDYSEEDEVSQDAVTMNCDGGSHSAENSVKVVNEGSDRERADQCPIQAAAPEDGDASQLVEDPQAPECDRNFALGLDSGTEHNSNEDHPSCEPPISLEGAVGRSMSDVSGGSNVELKLPSPSKCPDSSNLPSSDVTGVGAQSGQVNGNPDNVECGTEIGVELSEEYSDVEYSKQQQSVSAVSSTANQKETQKDISTPLCSVQSNSPSQAKASPGGSLPSHLGHPSPEQSRVSGVDSGDVEDDLLSELDAALHSHTDVSQLEPIVERATDSAMEPWMEGEQLSGSDSLPNGFSVAELCDSPQVKAIYEQLMRMQKQVEDSQTKLSRLHSEKQQQVEALATTVKERDSYLRQVQALKTRNPDDYYLPQIKELEYTIAQQQNEMRGLKDKLSSHDNAAKRAVSTLQNELKVRVDQVTKMYEECVREKDAMVVKYAESEQKNIECRKMVEKLETKIRESAKDRESMVSKVKAVKIEKHRAVADMEAKSSELTQALKEIEKMREALSSADVRIKWAQNKLRAELDSHKETKATLDKTNFKLKEAKEETMQIRRDCQAMIKTYQESEEIKSNSLDKELKVKETELIIQRQERDDREELYMMTSRELESLKVKHKDSLEELITIRDKLRGLEEERHQKQDMLTQFQGIMQQQKEENRDLHTKTSGMGQLQDDFSRAQDMIKTLDRDITDLMVTNKDLQQDMEGCRRRESELLDLTEKLSRKNAKLQSDNTNLTNQVVTLSSEAEKWKMEIQELETRGQDFEDNWTTEQRKRKEETESLRAELEEKTKHVDNYQQQLEDEKDLTRTLKRKHVNNLKDLTRQLQQARRKLEAHENHVERDTTSMGSRTSSNGSLNTLGDNATAHNNTNINSNHSSNSNSRAPSHEQEYPVITEQVEVDKQVLIERIVRLQKAHARKNEKLEFLDDHIHQLVDEIQKKNRIIQNYVMREESGTLAPEYMDENKLRARTESQALLAKKGGIMASVYSQHQQDGTMTLDLSLEINKKLQGVLEDTLLKNITLKESLDTLGTEIARLSQENRHMQLTIQELPH
ncbi:coiled-coil domain-containing protein 186-like isoform X1 [Haliotis rufescens]|uniref:coiled-coil domain-containing protein 186-like isoform X1 n=1 Tax=Haliotis rufescens TaxID=6454 RepID=UPI00201EF279|nr:coiled-coil domain-containing protein 186-like isoform X1 [Haliotis rufescens]